MLIAGILGSEGKFQTAGLINSILTQKGKRISVVDSKNFPGPDKKRIKSYISELERNNTDILLLKINPADIDGFFLSDMHFDIIIYTDKSVESDSAKPYYGMERAFSLMSDKGVAIVNVDDVELLNLLQGLRQHVVTYGFSTKASITTSSVGDSVLENNFICCLQRTISTRSGEVIEPQEYKLEFDGGGFDTRSVLAAASFAIVNGIDLNFHNSIQPLTQ